MTPRAAAPHVAPVLQPQATPLIGFGQVRHTRLRPAHHAFAYPTFFLMLPMRSLSAAHRPESALSINKPAALSFYDCDHGDGRGPSEGGALAWLDALLRSEGITDADGEVWLHCYPRVLGYTFKPVSFWYCHGQPSGPGDGPLRAIVVEVNNTFGERHCYLLDHPRYGQAQHAAKVFHVSPFCEVQGQYQFRFMRTEHAGVARTVVRIDYDDASGPLLQTSVSGHLTTITPAAVRRALWHYPAMTWGLITRIHWQALKLWTKRVRMVRKPAPPVQAVTR